MIAPSAQLQYRTWPVGFFCLATVWLNQFRARSANSGSELAEFEAAIITQYSRSLLLLIFSAKNCFSSTALLCYVVTDHHPQECWHWTTHTHQWDQGFFPEQHHKLHVFILLFNKPLFCIANKLKWCWEKEHFHCRVGCFSLSLTLSADSPRQMIYR